MKKSNGMASQISEQWLLHAWLLSAHCDLRLFCSFCSSFGSSFPAPPPPLPHPTFLVYRTALVHFVKFPNALLMIRAFRMSFICQSSVVFIIITHRNNFQGSFCTKLSHLPRQRNHIQRKQYFLLCLQAPLEVGFLFLSSDSSYRVRAKTRHSSYQIRACSHSILAENQLNRLIFFGSRSNLH